VFWLNGYGNDGSKGPLDPASREALRNEQVRDFAVRCRVAVQGLEPALIEAAFWQNLEQLSRPSLWIVDDLPSGLTSREIETRWVARWVGASTLITTRSTEYRSIGRGIDLEMLAEEEAFSLLTSRRPPQTQAECGSALGIVRALGCHPLAAEIAGSYLARGFTSYEKYQADLRDVDLDAIEFGAELAETLPTDHARSVSATLLCSVRIAEEPARTTAGRLPRQSTPAGRPKDFPRLLDWRRRVCKFPGMCTVGRMRRLLITCSAPFYRSGQRGELAGLKEEPQAELHASLTHRRREYLAFRGIAYGRVWGGEVRVIESVEHVGSELQVDTLGEFELLEEGRIELLHAIGVQWIDARVSISFGDQVINEAARIEPHVRRRIGDRTVADPIWPIALPIVEKAYRGVNVEARSTGNVDQPGILPSAEDSIENPVHVRQECLALPERKLEDQLCIESVRDVLRSWSVVLINVIRIQVVTVREVTSVCIIGIQIDVLADVSCEAGRQRVIVATGRREAYRYIPELRILAIQWSRQIIVRAWRLRRRLVYVQ